MDRMNDVRLLGEAALITSSAFSGAALYISLAENPATLSIGDDKGMLEHWKTSYAKSAPMQAGLAAISGAIGSTIAYKTGDTRWLVGAGLMLCIWPYTMVCIMPIKKELYSIPNELSTKQQTADLINQWGNLHAVRTLLGVAAVGAFVWTLNSSK